MTRNILIIMIMCTISSCSNEHEGSKITKGQFTGVYIQKLKEMEPLLKVTNEGDMVLKLSYKGQECQTAFLNNAYNAYKADSSTLNDILDRYTRASLESAKMSEEDKKLDTTRIVPVVKDADYIVDIHATLKQYGHDMSKFDQYYEKLNEELFVFYALDTEHNIRYLTTEDVKTLAMNKQELRKLAISNLDNLLPEIKSENLNGLYMLTAGGTYEASIILFEQIWNKENFDVRGDIVIAIPSRDILFVSGSENKEAISRIKKIAKDVINEGNYTLTNQLFKRDVDKWSKVNL